MATFYVQELVNDALGERSSRKSDLFDHAIGHARWLVSTRRTDERRKVNTYLYCCVKLIKLKLYMKLLGKEAAYQKFKKMTNAEIAKQLIKSWKGELNLHTMEIYERNVALLVSIYLLNEYPSSMYHVPFHFHAEKVYQRGT